MSARDVLTNVADQYRKEGYDVVVAPAAEQLPGALADLGVDLVAHRGNERVAVRVKGRHELYDLQPPPDARALPQGWSLDLVVYPPAASEEIARNGAPETPEYARTLIEEAEQLLQAGALRASFLIAWSAAEAAMRGAVRRAGLALEPETPRFVLKTAYSNGITSRDDYDRLQRGLDLRNRIAHGLPADGLSREDAQFLAEFARGLLPSGAEQTDLRATVPPS